MWKSCHGLREGKYFLKNIIPLSKFNKVLGRYLGSIGRLKLQHCCNFHLVWFALTLLFLNEPNLLNNITQSERLVCSGNAPINTKDEEGEAEEEENPSSI